MMLLVGFVTSVDLSKVGESVDKVEDIKDKLTNEPDYFSKKVEDWFKKSFVGKFIEKYSSKFQFLFGVGHSEPVKLFLTLFFVGVLFFVLNNLSYFLVSFFSNPEGRIRGLIFVLTYIFVLIFHIPFFLSNMGVFFFNRLDSFFYKSIYFIGFIMLILFLTTFSKSLRGISIESGREKRLKDVEESSKKTKKNLRNLKEKIREKAKESSGTGMSWEEFLEEAQNLSEQIDLSSSDLEESTRFIKKFKPDFKEGIH